MKHWTVSASKDAIVIICRGHDRDGTADRAVAEFEALTKGRDRFKIIADLSEMTGYETNARLVWQSCFLAMRERIAGLTVVGAKSTMIKMGATMVGLFANIPMRFVDDWSGLADYR